MSTGIGQDHLVMRSSGLTSRTDRDSRTARSQASLGFGAGSIVAGASARCLAHGPQTAGSSPSASPSSDISTPHRWQARRPRSGDGRSVNHCERGTAG
jgi:hypothetical protein